MPSKAYITIVLLLFISTKVLSQANEEKSKHYLSLSIHPQYVFKPNDRILIFPLSYEYLPKFFNHRYGVGIALNFNDIKLNYQKEFSLGVRNAFYLLKNPKFRPYLGFGVYNSNPKLLNEWYWKKYRSGQWQARVFIGTRLKVSKNYMIFAEYGNYRIGSPKFNCGVGLTRVFNP